MFNLCRTSLVPVVSHLRIQSPNGLPICVVTTMHGCFFNEVRDAASNSAYNGYPKLWILRYPAHRYHAVPSPGFEPTTLWLRVRDVLTIRPRRSIEYSCIQGCRHWVVTWLLGTLFGRALSGCSGGL
jgi:hypothetical protein